MIAVLPAAGIGSRMQAECPKQYLTIGRHSIVEHAIHALLRHPRIERVIVAIGPEDRQFEQLPIARDPRVIVTEGGRQRADSVMAGLQLAGDADWVLVHDAARPCLHADDPSACWRSPHTARSAAFRRTGARHHEARRTRPRNHRPHRRTP